MSASLVEPGLSQIPGVKRIYLSGPMTGLAAFNYPAFHSAAAVLRAVGYEVYSPAEDAEGNYVDRSGCTGFEKPADIGFDLRSAFADFARHITTEADAVAVLPGWEASRGARAEVALAQAVGMPIIDALTGEIVEASLTVTAEPAPSEWVCHTLCDFEVTARHTDKCGEQPSEQEPQADVIPLGPTGSGHAKPLYDAARAATEPQSEPRLRVPATPRERSEIKVTSATGGSKAQKEAALHLVPAGPLWELAVLYGRGQMKYPDAVSGAPNWKRGYPWSSSYSALIRHANLFWMGEDHDPEMAVKHLIAVAWHAFNLAWFMENRPEFDDRPTSVNGETYEGALPTPQWLLDLTTQRSEDS